MDIKLDLDKQHLKDLEQHQKEKLINKTILLWLNLSIMLYAAAIIRALSIGFCLRDLIQLVFLIIIAVLYWLKGYLSTLFKINIIAAMFLLIGLLGVYSLGILSGSVFSSHYQQSLFRYIFPSDLFIIILLLL